MPDLDTIAAPSRAQSTIKRKIGYGVVLLLILIVLSELTIRSFFWVTHMDIAAFDIDYRVYQPHPFLGFTLKPSVKINHPSMHYKTNAFGFRGEEISAIKGPDTVRIFCLGGSSAWGHGLHDTETWPYKLQKELQKMYPARRIEVVNAGVPGYTTFQSMINFQTNILDFQPDIIIVYHVWNDIKYWTEITPTHNFSRTGLAFDKPPQTFLDRILHKSYTFIFLGAIKRIIKERFSNRYARGGEPVPEKTSGKRIDFSYGESVYRRNLRNIIATAKANGVITVLSNELTLIKKNSSKEEDLKIMWFLPKDKMIQAFDDADNILRELSASERVEFVDIRNSVPSNLKTLRDHIHPMVEGCDRIAHVFSQRLKIIIDSHCR